MVYVGVKYIYDMKSLDTKARRKGNNQIRVYIHSLMLQWKYLDLP